jgi:hypothetical protein
MMRRVRGFATLEAVGAAAVLSLAIGSLVLLMAISVSPRHQAYLRAQLRARLLIHLTEIQGEAGESLDCASRLEEVLQEHIQDRNYQIQRSIRSISWEGSGGAPTVLQLSASAISADSRYSRSESIALLIPCIRTGP